MPDIAMCKGFNCPLKEKCYRFKAVPNEYRQSYYMNPPYDKVKNECKHLYTFDKSLKIKKNDT